MYVIWCGWGAGRGCAPGGGGGGRSDDLQLTKWLLATMKSNAGCVEKFFGGPKGVKGNDLGFKNGW